MTVLVVTPLVLAGLGPLTGHTSFRLHPEDL